MSDNNEPKVKEILMRGFKAVMSTGDDVQIEQDEIDTVIAAAAAGRLIRVRQGIINPSYLVSITEDKRRELRYTPGFRSEQQCLGLAPLKDIFSKRPALGPPKGGADGGRPTGQLPAKP